MFTLVSPNQSAPCAPADCQRAVKALQKPPYPCARLIPNGWRRTKISGPKRKTGLLIPIFRPPTKLFPCCVGASSARPRAEGRSALRVWLPLCHAVAEVVRAWPATPGMLHLARARLKLPSSASRQQAATLQSTAPIFLTAGILAVGLGRENWDTTGIRRVVFPERTEWAQYDSWKDSDFVRALADCTGMEMPKPLSVGRWSGAWRRAGV